MTILQRALEFLKLGISVIPLRHRSKEPMLKTWKPYQPHTEYSLLPTENDLIRWFGSGWQNYGVVAGWNNLAFLDFDDFDTFKLWKDYIELLKIPMPFTVLSARGAHVYISLPTDGFNEKRQGLEVNRHGYVVGPGSTHPNGTQYVGLGPLRIMPVESLETILPEDLFPHVAPVTCFNGAAAVITPNTEYKFDPFASAGMDLITKVKHAVRIESFFVDIKRTSVDGRWYAALCPFHDDHNPSMWIDVRQQLCGCQVCGMKPMDAINLYSRMKNIPESAAITMMAQEVGVWA